MIDHRQHTAKHNASTQPLVKWLGIEPNVAVKFDVRADTHGVNDTAVISFGSIAAAEATLAKLYVGQHEMWKDLKDESSLAFMVTRDGDLVIRSVGTNVVRVDG